MNSIIQDEMIYEDQLINLENPVCAQRAPDSAPIVESKFSTFELVLLVFMWLLVFASSIRNFGRLPGALFIILNVFLVIRKPASGLLVLLLIAFTPAVSLSIPRIFVVSSIILVFGCIVRGNVFKLLFLNKTIFLGMGFVVSAVLAFFIARDRQIALVYLKDYTESLILLILIFVAIDTSEALGSLLKWLSILGALALIISFTHHLLGSSTVLYGIVARVHGEEITAAKATLERGGESVRFLWPGAEPSYFAAQLLFPLAVSLGLLSSSTGVSRKSFWALMAVMNVVCIFGSFSRSGYLAAFALGVLFVGQRNLKALIPMLILTLAFLLLLSVVPVIKERIISISEAVATGATGRFRFFGVAFKLWLSSPLWGNGLGLTLALTGYATHNTFLQILAEIGLIGEIFFLGMIVLALNSIRTGKKLYFDKSNPDVVFFSVLSLGLISTCLQLNTITYHDPKFLWLLCAACNMFYLMKKREISEYAFSLSEEYL